MSATDDGAESPRVESFAAPKTPVLNPDVSTYQDLLDKKAQRVRELFGERLSVCSFCQRACMRTQACACVCLRV